MPFQIRAFLSLILIASGTWANLWADVRIVRIPKGGQVPDVVRDVKGTLHVVYGNGLPGDAFYLQSTDEGLTFSRAVRLNQRAATVTTGMERGPKIALGKDGMIHVVWLGYYRKGGGVWYTRSTDGGRSFDAERRLNEPDYGLDNATVAADGEGNVAVLWTGGFPGVKDDPDSPAASPIILTRSTDSGRSFSRNALLLSDSAVSSRACGCCRLEARMTGESLVIAFRSGYKNVRDPYLLYGPKVKNDFICKRVSIDNWETGCPMQGPALYIDAKDRMLVAWMYDDRAYFAMAQWTAKLENFGKAISPANKNKQAFPTALQNADGEIFLMWREGHDLCYTNYNAQGVSLRNLGRTPVHGMHRPTGFVDGKGNFAIVY